MLCLHTSMVDWSQVRRGLSSGRKIRTVVAAQPWPGAFAAGVQWSPKLPGLGKGVAAAAIERRRQVE